jgi:hypothetical protein
MHRQTSLSPYQTGMPILADDEVAVHGDAGRARDLFLVNGTSALEGAGRRSDESSIKTMASHIILKTRAFPQTRNGR